MSVRFVDIHVLQSVPPSCVNRDDTGSPKSAIYGGVRRARVSSQAWKRAARAEFENHLDRSDLGVRTKRVLELIVNDMAELAPDMPLEQRLERATKVLEVGKLKPKPVKAKKNAAEGEEPGIAETDYLIFFSRAQIRSLAEIALNSDKPTAKEVLAAASSEHGVEVSLFGRMVADNKLLSVDASVQVAHALSTHGAEIESDYFTAVDDERDADDQGADMIGVIDFTSATLYRYATINMDLLAENLGDEGAAIRAAQAFVRAYALSMPTGKQNTFANRTLPEAVVVVLRDDQPVNAVGAFEAPVLAKGQGLVAESARRLAERLASVQSFLDAPIATFVTTSSGAADVLAAGSGVPFTSLVEAVGESLAASFVTT